MSLFEKFVSFFKNRQLGGEEYEASSRKMGRNRDQNEKSRPRQSMVGIILQTIDGKKHNLRCKQTLTCEGLKQFIYQKLCQSLLPKRMNLMKDREVIVNSTQMGELQKNGENIVMIQQVKVSIAQVSAIIADADGIDPISYESGVAVMPCGHQIGRDSMTKMVRFICSTKRKFEVRCPFINQRDEICNAIWDFNVCKRVGVFTKEEIQEFERGLAEGWMSLFAKRCPNCKQMVSNVGLKINRVVCVSCKYGDFCYKCLRKWSGHSNQFCGNEECKFENEYVKGSPLNHKFDLRDRRNRVIVKTILTPQLRSCPHCNEVIKHADACKHIKCSSCSGYFCWVCLSVPRDGKWTCGVYDEYCGEVTPGKNEEQQ